MLVLRGRAAVGAAGRTALPDGTLRQRLSGFTSERRECGRRREAEAAEAAEVGGPFAAEEIRACWSSGGGDAAR